MLVAKLLLPLYSAVIVSVPCGNAEVVKTAMPPETTTGLPKSCEPEKKVTDPLFGVPAPEVTVAVIVTG